MSLDELRGAEWVHASSPFELGGRPVAWQLSFRSDADSALTEWNVYFTTGVPPEALIDLLMEIDAREAPDVGFEGPRQSSPHSSHGPGSATSTGPAPPPLTLGSPPASLWRCCRRLSRTLPRVSI
ncbi:DUF317 domain-containing protein [Streptomyces sp. NPDC050658]|uniref:DUF317 domain-containing protein n=1 Tax=unclassified Streptomyces TaxID=2593676 RepID=UPI00342ECC38